MKTWSIDASEINPSEIPTDYIFKNQTIKDYLDPSSHERKLFLIGSKGCGKTLLLRFKAYHYLKKMNTDSSNGLIISGSDELVESLSFQTRTLSAKDIMALVDITLWQKIWQFSIALLALRKLDIELIPPLRHLDETFFKYYSLGSIVSKLINNQDDYLRKPRFENDMMELAGMLSLVKNQFVMFVDRLDQALDQFLSSSEYKYLDNIDGQSIPFKVWQAAQYGLLHTSYDLTTGSNPHIKIFATARKEALDVKSQVSANVRNYCTFLDYTPEELRQIFENNVRHTAKKHLFSDPNTTDAFEAFFGFKNMKHPVAKDEYEEQRTEHVFHFLRRHTFERPREIIQMGRLVFDNLLTKDEYANRSAEEKKQAVRRVVNDASYKIVFRHYSNEIVPEFRDEYIREMAEVFGRNLVTLELFQKVNRDHANYLYRAGLIGHVKKGKQHFLPASMHIHDTHVRIPRSDYYVLHPSLDPIFMENHSGLGFYSDFCIVGNNYDFHPPVVVQYSKKGLKSLLPTELPGLGSKTEFWPRANIMVDAHSLYKEYFQIDVSTFTEHKLRPRKMMRQALNILRIVAHINAFEKVIEHFSLPENSPIQARLADLKEKLRAKYDEYHYTTSIDIINDESLRHFESRLQGRLVALGIFIYLSNFSNFRVKQVVQEYTVDIPSGLDQEDTAVRFLRKAFFIAGLRANGILTTNDRKTILYKASS